MSKPNRLAVLINIFDVMRTASPFITTAEAHETRDLLRELQSARVELERLTQSNKCLQMAVDTDLNLSAMGAIREACLEIMGGNCAFIDDDFARALLTVRDHRDAARVELERMRAANQWQPIDTAPRDGTRVFICRANCGEYEWAYVARCFSKRWRILEQVNNGVTIAHTSVSDEPTHWLPLPPPPYAAQPNEVAGS